MNISLSLVLSLLVQAALQIFSIAMVPLSKGFTKPLPAILCVTAFGLALFLVARLQHDGANLSVIVPLLAAIVPLGSIITMLLFFGETASMAKIALLVTACLIIGAAAKVG